MIPPQRSGIRTFVSKVYFKPLVPQSMLSEVSPGHVFRRFQKEMLREIKREFQSGAFSPRARRALSKSLSMTVQGKTLVIESNHPGWRPLVEGQRPGPMTWLAKARAVVPIVTDQGKVIFRTATPRSLKGGGWVHPGRKNTHLIDRAKQTARAHLKEILREELSQQFRRGM